MKSNIFKTLVAAAALALTFNACSEDKYTSRGDLFQPRFATSPEVTIKNNNDISIIWYNVNDAVGYTVQIFEDNYYQNLFLETDVTEPYITLEDLPYASRYYVRVRSNAVNPENNSQWATCNFTTEAVPTTPTSFRAYRKPRLETTRPSSAGLLTPRTPQTRLLLLRQ